MECEICDPPQPFSMDLLLTKDYHIISTKKFSKEIDFMEPIELNYRTIPLFNTTYLKHTIIDSLSAKNNPELIQKIDKFLINPPYKTEIPKFPSNSRDFAFCCQKLRFKIPSQTTKKILSGKIGEPNYPLPTLVFADPEVINKKIPKSGKGKGYIPNEFLKRVSKPVFHKKKKEIFEN